MESGLRVLLLSRLAVAATGCSVFGRDAAPPEDAGASAPVISPEVERREVKTPKIDTENFELSAYYGLIVVEDFGSNSVVGGRMAYHITEGLFLEGTYADAGDVEESSIEVVEGDLTILNDRGYSYYNVALGWNLLPGEVFLGRNHAFNSALYVIAGAGNTKFNDEDQFALTFGAGYRILATDSIGVHFDVRDHVFESTVLGVDKTTHNMEFSLGLSWFF